ncbi:MAG TPA: DUF2231 domain-containing protein [Vicinamibacteria bacterium]|nr:DUF2231 domain-containing protein [Vicinamibacteria bacterium]
MSDLPLHPALVHLPLGLAFVMPLLALILAWALWTGRAARRTWAIVVALQAVLLAGGLVALRTGEAQEERVERIVGDAALARHETAAEQFVWASALTLGLAAAGLLLKKRGPMRAVLVLTALGSIIVTGLAVRTGHAGGRLVYVHGAASAYSGVDEAAAGNPEEERER